MSNDQSLSVVGFISYKTLNWLKQVQQEAGLSHSATVALLIEEALTARGFPVEINRHFHGGHRNKYGVAAYVAPNARIYTDEK